MADNAKVDNSFLAKWPVHPRTCLRCLENCNSKIQKFVKLCFEFGIVDEEGLKTPKRVFISVYCDEDVDRAVDCCCPKLGLSGHEFHCEVWPTMLLVVLGTKMEWGRNRWTIGSSISNEGRCGLPSRSFNKDAIVKSHCISLNSNYHHSLSPLYNMATMVLISIVVSFVAPKMSCLHVTLATYWSRVHSWPSRTAAAGRGCRAKASSHLSQ